MRRSVRTERPPWSCMPVSAHSVAVSVALVQASRPVAGVVAVGDLVGGAPDQGARGLELKSHVGEVVLDGLELVDGPAERLAVVDEL